MQVLTLMQGYDRSHLQPHPRSCVIVSNAMKRGIDAIEYMLNEGSLIFLAQFLADHVLQGKHVLRCRRTHKNHNHDHAGLGAGSGRFKSWFLIGGVPLGFSEKRTFRWWQILLVEADDYDSAFFDKRSKFVHHHPKTAILNNLEFDHADIFVDLRQFKTVSPFSAYHSK